MADIIQARVFQKVDTLANWNANSLILGAGEQAFVEGSLGEPIIYKVGDGTKKFSDLQWPDFTVRSKAAPSFVFSGQPSGIYIPTDNGTYNGSTTVSLTDGYQVLYWDGSVLVKVVYPVDLSGYYTKTSIDSQFAALTGVNPPYSANPNNDYSIMTQVFGNGVNYYNNWDASQARVINKVKIKFSDSGQFVVVKFSSSNVASDQQTINTTAGVNEYSITPVNLAIGEHLGVRKLSGTANYKSTLGVGMYAGDSGLVVANNEISYSISGNYATGTTYDSLVKLTSDNAAQNVSIASNNAAITANATSITNIIGVTPPFLFSPNNDYAIIVQPASLNTDYYNNWDSTKVRSVNKVKIKFTTAGSFVVTKFSVTNGITDMQTITATSGVNEYSITPVVLQIGEHLGVRVTSGSFYYKSTLGVGMYTTTGMVAGYEIGYSISGNYVTGTTYDTLVDLTAKVSTLNSTISQLFVAPKSKVALFTDLMSTQNSNWQLTGWSFSAGGFTSTGTGMNNRLNLNIPYHVDKRTARFLVTFSSDSDLRLHCKYGGVGNTGEGASMVGVNVSTGKLSIYAAQGGVDGVEPATTSGVQETVTLRQVNLGFTIDTTRLYLLELTKDNLTTKVNLTDTVSGSTISTSYTGWACGRQNENYGFYVYSGGSVKISAASVVTKNNPDLVIVGDSITEGVYNPGRANSWARTFRNKTFGYGVISARGGDNIDGVIAKFASEFSIYKPKNMLLMIGTNAGNTTAKIQQVVDLCAANSINLYWNNVVCKSSDGHLAINSMLAPFNFRGMKFDIATALQNVPTVDGSHPSPRYNPALYGDAGVHPNDAGQLELIKRFQIDLPELLDGYNY